jgi:hypothetical protein
MPIEIRELVIRATVTQEADSAKGMAGDAASGNNNVSASEEIINTCIEKVMGILKEKYER